MRIALVSQEYPPETAKGGIGTQTFQKAHGLAALGHQVHVISRSPKTARTESARDGVHVTRIPGLEARMGIYTPAADWMSYSSEVAAAITALHATAPLDVIDFPEWGAEGYIHLLNQTEWNRIPTVIQLHGPLVMFAHTIGWPDLDSEFYRSGRFMEQTCLRLADAVFSSSSCSAHWCAQHYGLDSTLVPVLHTGVDTTLFSPRPVPKADRPTIVFAGKLAPNKGVRLLLEAVGNLVGEFPRLRLRLLGRGEPNFIAELQARAQAKGWADSLEMTGFVDRDDLPDQFSRAHIFAAPSQYEGGPGFVYLEAMACGLPVIACAGSGAAEVIREGENGLLVPPQDEAALTAALRQLLQNPGQRESLGSRARSFVLRTADSRACLKKLETFYSEVIGRNL